MKELLKQLGTSFKVVELDIESKSKQTLCIFQTACLLAFFLCCLWNIWCCEWRNLSLSLADYADSPVMYVEWMNVLSMWMRLAALHWNHMLFVQFCFLQQTTNSWNPCMFWFLKVMEVKFKQLWQSGLGREPYPMCSLGVNTSVAATVCPFYFSSLLTPILFCK